MTKVASPKMDKKTHQTGGLFVAICLRQGKYFSTIHLLWNGKMSNSTEFTHSILYRLRFFSADPKNDPCQYI
ncbi:MAG: hypothetical protein HFP77_07190 [Methylococcales symbiont of Iophon sp. n. MRB-2018]|nr:MAG: hypothetical protein HFP77_07190 [Methylococcales symbiont of Iophon sp. n. MRB-2018]KAF3979620.1 MAG: hypothetical protein HFP76_06260 [Methylococcales symbiont of Iophon sp. n. MRB-2018]